MFPVYLVAGLINILAKSNNYGIKINNTEMDIRVRRDIQNADVPTISDTDSMKIYNADYVREKRQSLPLYNQNGILDSDNNRKNSNNLRNNHTLHKRKRHNNGMYVPHSRSRYHTIPVHNSTTATGFRSESLVREYNEPIVHNYQNQVSNTVEKSFVSLPTPQPYAKPEENTSKPWYKKVWANLSGHGTSDKNSGNTQKRKRKHKIMAACVICDIPCPAGYHKQQTYCIEDDPDYE